MKKLFIMPVFVLFMTGSASNGVEPAIKPQAAVIPVEPISVRVDSINVKATELRDLIKRL